MALYSYLCSQGHIKDERRDMDRRDDPGWCPHCGRPVRRLISRPYLRLSQVAYTRRPEPNERALLDAWENPDNV